MKALFYRKGQHITNIETGSTMDYKTVNKAKKESFKIQMSNGGLGRGSLFVK